MTTHISPTLTKEILLQVIDDLSTERITELLEFALFMKARQLKQPFQVEAYLKELLSHPTTTDSQFSDSLHGTVLAYDDPFTPVAETDWEVLS